MAARCAALDQVDESFGSPLTGSIRQVARAGFAGLSISLEPPLGVGPLGFEEPVDLVLQRLLDGRPGNVVEVSVDMEALVVVLGVADALVVVSRVGAVLVGVQLPAGQGLLELAPGEVDCVGDEFGLVTGEEAFEAVDVESAERSDVLGGDVAGVERRLGVGHIAQRPGESQLGRRLLWAMAGLVLEPFGGCARSVSPP